MEGVGPMGRCGEEAGGGRGGGRVCNIIFLSFFCLWGDGAWAGTHVLGIFSRQVGQLD